METIIVTSKGADWPWDIEGVEVVQASEYLANERWTSARGVRVFNLCRSYRYQSYGYYVSLLATARGHRSFPNLMTLLDMKSRALVRSTQDELVDLIQKALAPLHSDRFTLSIYFGRNLARRYDSLALRLFNAYPAPLLRAQFVRAESWRLSSIGPIPARDIPESHADFVLEAAREYFARPRYRSRPSRAARYALAILQDPEEELAPSDPRALRRFRAAGEKLGFSVEMIGKDDYSRLPEFDALFLRETTAVNHHTFRFAQRAASEGLVVIDDPESILRCTNKIFQAEGFAQRRIPAPRSFIADANGLDAALEAIGLPCVLKFPDSSFSQGVFCCRTREEFDQRAREVLETSELLLVQAFLPSSFDWRVGILAGEPLYACRYQMARGHWQIMKREASGKLSFGKTETLEIADVPAHVLSTALKAAKLIGDGLYGVDLKEIDGKAYVIEVNDNPSIDAGHEDAVIKDELYMRIMRVFLQRIESAKSRSER